MYRPPGRFISRAVRGLLTIDGPGECRGVMGWDRCIVCPCFSCSQATWSQLVVDAAKYSSPGFRAASALTPCGFPQTSESPALPMGNCRHAGELAISSAVATVRDNQLCTRCLEHSEPGSDNVSGLGRSHLPVPSFRRCGGLGDGINGLSVPAFAGGRCLTSGCLTHRETGKDEGSTGIGSTMPNEMGARGSPRTPTSTPGGKDETT